MEEKSPSLVADAPEFDANRFSIEMIIEGVRSRFDRIQKAKANPRFSFAHYTSADTALTILRTQTIWLRNARLMNDFSEIEYGRHCWNYMLDSPVGASLRRLVMGIFPELRDHPGMNWSDLQQRLLNQTYLFSLSEHATPGIGKKKLDPEDYFGRLSMWRAYGVPHGAALRIGKSVLLSETDLLNVYAMPVEYPTPVEFTRSIKKFIRFLRRNRMKVQALGAAQFVANLKFLYLTTLVSTKHPGFSEEREWRLVHSPQYLEIFDVGAAHHDVTAFIDRTLGGVPQEILTLRIDRLREWGLKSARPDSVIERVILGPTQAPRVILDQFLKCMTAMGIPADRLIASDVPLRT